MSTTSVENFVILAAAPDFSWSCVARGRTTADALAASLTANGLDVTVAPAVGVVKDDADLDVVVASVLANRAAKAATFSRRTPFDRTTLPPYLADVLTALDRDGWNWDVFDEAVEEGYAPGFSYMDFVPSGYFYSMASDLPGLERELCVLFFASSAVVAETGQVRRSHDELTRAMAHGFTTEGLLSTFLTVEPATLAWAALPADVVSDLRLRAYSELPAGTPGAKELLMSYAAWAEDSDEADALAAGTASTPVVPHTTTSLELWLDTTMWNEGFEEADHAMASVVLADPAEVAAFQSWVASHLAGFRRDSDRLFHVQTRRSGGTLPTTFAAAVKVAQLADRLWDGI